MTSVADPGGRVRSGDHRPLDRRRLDDVLGFTLTDEQWAVAAGPLSPAVVVAGAGSGKTTSMAARVAWLVGSGIVPADAVLGLTFTTKAAAQLLTSMRRSIAALPGSADDGSADDGSADDGSAEPTVLTYHAFGARLLAEHGIRLGREPGAPVLADGERQQLAYQLVCTSTLPLAGLGRSPVDITGLLLRLDDELAELAIDPATLAGFDRDQARMLRAHDRLQNAGRALLATSEHRAVLADLVAAWRRHKHERDVIDFSDQIRLAGELAASFTDVVEDCRTRFRVVLLDEYQDTSISQRMLLQRLFGAGHPVLAVGDPCQAIYGWRGASVDNIDRFDEHFATVPGADVARLPLSQNRRSGPRILAAANHTSTALREVHRGVRALEPAPDATGGDPGALACALFSTYDDEVSWLAQQIRATHDRRGSAVAWNQIAVLAATAADLVRVDAALRRLGVPTRLVGAAALLEQPAVVELRSMLQMIHDPTENPAVARLAAGPRWRIGPRDLAALGRRARALAGVAGRPAQDTVDEALASAVTSTDRVETVSLSEAIADLGDRSAFSAEAAARFDRWAAEVHELRRHVAEPLSDFVRRVIDVTGLAVEVSLGDPAVRRTQQAALHAFADLAAAFSPTDGRSSLGAFLSRLASIERLEADLDLDLDSASDAVNLLTVHKAKGLEFDVVFVPFVSQGAFPGGRGRPSWLTSPAAVPWPLRADCTEELASYPSIDHSPRSVEEKEYRAILAQAESLADRRLAYVAFTRARRGLMVSGHWWGPTQARSRGPSPFLQAIHDVCVDGVGEVVHWAPAPEPDSVNPQLASSARPVRWPAPVDADRQAVAREVAAAVRAVESVQLDLGGIPGRPDPCGVEPAGRMSDPATEPDVARIARWDLLVEALLAEQRSRSGSDRSVPLPDSVSATLLARSRSDPDGVARDLVRPMPRRPSQSARLGTRFHAWVEARFGQQSLLDPDDLPGAADDELAESVSLEELTAAFEAGPYADREPVAVEFPFSIVVAGRVVSGRIDAVFADGADVEIVDWKTGSAGHVDPMQLAIYRLAWSRATGVPVSRIRACFVIVGTGAVLRPPTDELVAALTS